MAIPFARAADLAARLKRPVWDDPAELLQVDTFLEDASDDLRAEIGWQVYPPVEVTVSATPDMHGRVGLVGSPIVGVTSVADPSGSVISSDHYNLRDGVLWLHHLDPMSITYTVGYREPPPELLKWTCVIAAQTLAAAADDRLGATPSSEALAEWRVSYSERQQMGELPVPERVLERLRSTYGQSVFTT